MVGEDTAPLFADKKTNKTIETQVAAQHGTSRGKRGLKVAKINDQVV